MVTRAEGASELAGVDWGRVYAQALVLARASVRAQDVDDLVTEGMKRVLEGAAPWDATGRQSLAEYIVAVGYNAQREEWRKTSRPHKPGLVERLRAMVQDNAPKTPEDAVGEAELRQRKAHLFERLVRESAGDPEATAVLECEGLGINEPAEQALRTGLGIEAVRNARKRIKRRALDIVQAERDKEGGL